MVSANKRVNGLQWLSVHFLLYHKFLKCAGLRFKAKAFFFYLPFFKLNPEIKFCFGLTDILKHDRPDLVDDPQKLKMTESLTKVKSNMIVLTFYFE